MTTATEYALMAGAAYRSTRDPKNRFPIPQGWNQISYSPPAPSGFEAVSFTNGTDIVISYAGTYEKDKLGDIAADIGLATGFGSAQLLQAAEYYLQVKAANPFATITLTGHSLGGGLAALVGVFFGVQAFTFDQAPFANSAELNLLTPDVAANLRSDLAAQLDVNGNRRYSDAALFGLTNFLYLRAANGYIPNSGLVSNIRVNGEFLSSAPLSLYDTIGNPATVLDHGPYADPSLDMHSQALLTAFLQSDQTAATGKALSDVTYNLTDVLGMMFDENLFENDTDTDKKNFLDHLVRHEAGIGVTLPADAMVTRFTSDLWKLAQPGGLTMSDNNPTNAAVNDLSKALIAFAMQKYYEEQLAAGATPAELFTDLTAAGTGSNGIQFDMADVSPTFKAAFDTNQKLTLKDAKGFDLYFKHYLGTTNNFTPAEQQLIQSLLPYLRDWYVQAGASGMNATDALNRGAFMLGGSGSDALVGGIATDLLVGNAGNDLLQGGKGNDVLLGGTGNDTYVYTAGDGFDIILDRDGQGSIAYDGATLAGGAQYGDNRVHRDADKHLYVNVGLGRLVIDGNILIEDQQAGELGLAMSGTVAESVSVYTIEGDLEVIDSDPAAGGIQWNRGMFGNLLTDAAKPQGGRSDLLTGGADNDTLIGKGGSDILDGRAGDDRLYADTQVSVVDAIANGNNQSGSGQQGDWLNAGAGDDTLIGSNGNDMLAGGIGSDILIGGAGDDLLLADNDSMAGDGFNDQEATYNPNWWFVNNSNGTGTFLNTYNIPSPDFGWDLARAQTDVIYAGEGNDFAWGGRGNDVIFGEGGADTLAGNSGNDILLGGDGKDILHGDVTENVDIPVIDGNDYLDGGAQDDVIYGNGGDDIMIGGKGSDTLSGGAGNDIYLYSAGDGVDYIYDYFRAGEKNVIRFGAGVNQNNIRLGLGSLLLDLGNGDAVHIAGFNQNNVFNSSSISSFEFADGTVLTTAELLVRGFDLEGTNGDDAIISITDPDTGIVTTTDRSLYGTNFTDRINGLDGNDTLVGDAGNDILSGGAGDDLMAGGTGDDALYGGIGNDELQGSAGNDVLSGDEGDDLLFGEGDDDILTGGTGNDYLAGGQGNDTYLFNAGDGGATLDDAEGINQIVFGTGITLDNLQVSSTNSNGVQYLHIGYNSTDYLLVGGARSNQTFTFSDGATISHAEFLQQKAPALFIAGTRQADIFYGGNQNDSLFGNTGDDVISGQGGNDMLMADEGNDTLNGGPGGDQLLGGVGDDTYVLQLGDGNDKIIDPKGVNTLRFGAGILLQDLRAELPINSSDIVLYYSATDQITLYNGQNGTISQYQFQNGTLLNQEQLLGFALREPLNLTGTVSDDVLQGGRAIDILDGQMGNDRLLGGGGGDTLRGGEGNDTLVGGTGDDNLQGGNGNDSYEVQLGDGADTIVDTSGANRIRFGAGILPEALLLGRQAGLNGEDYLVLQYSATDQVAIQDGLQGRIQNYEFANGQVISHAQLIEQFFPAALLISGGAEVDTFFGSRFNDVLEGWGGSDTLRSGAGDDVLVGGGGNDTLVGGLGTDSYLIGPGMGTDTITENPGGLNRILLQAGVSLPDLAVRRTGDGLNLYLRSTGEGVVLKDYYLAQQNWTLEDAGGVGTTLSEFLAQQAQTEPVLSMDDWIQKAKSDFSLTLQNSLFDILLGDGYTPNEDGSLRTVYTRQYYTYEIFGGSVQYLPSQYIASINNVTSDITGSLKTTLTISDANDIYAHTSPGAENTTTFYSSHITAGSETLTRTLMPQGNADQALIPIRFYSLADLPSSGIGLDPGSYTPTYGFNPATGENELVGYTQYEPSSLAVSETISYQVPVTQASTVETAQVVIEEINGGVSDNNVHINGYSIVDAGAGNDIISPGYLVKDESVSERTDSSFAHKIGDFWHGNAAFLYGNAGDDVVLGSDGRDTIIASSGNDYLNGFGDGDFYRVFPFSQGSNLIFDTGAARGSPDLPPSEADYPITLDGVPRDANGQVGVTKEIVRRLDQEIANYSHLGLPAIRGLEILLGSNLLDKSPLPVPDEIPLAYEFDKLKPYYEAGLLPQDTVIFEAGIRLQDLQYTWTEVNLSSAHAALTIRWGPDASITVVIPNAEDPIGTGVERFEFSDGSMLSMTDLIALAPPAPSFNVQDENNLFANTSANEQFNGYQGNDTYTFGRGNGQDLIYDYDTTTGNADVIQLAANVSPGDVTFRRKGNDLIVGINGTTDQLRLTSWFLSDAYKIEGIQFADGTVWDAETLRNIVPGTGGNDSLYGTSAGNMIYGHEGNDLLDGAAGADVLIGGLGDDTYGVDDVSDIVMEGINEGMDSVQSSIDYTLGMNVESLLLTGTAAISGVGNDLDNILTGNGANNTLTGGAGKDRLDGGGGADKMLGGTDNDTYVVDSTADVVIENANEGTDTVQSEITYTLGANVENLTLTGATAINGTGNTFDNMLIGNSAINTLTGGAGNDTLDGGGDADKLTGGAGNDIYLVDNTGDVVTELASEGTDAVQSSVTHMLAANVENLTLTGVTAINGAGNILDNVLIGNSAINTLTGGAGNDTLDGGADADMLTGGAGNDIYVVDNTGDVVTELGREGADTVQSSVTHTLAANVENLTLTGMAAINGTGNTLNNVLIGNSTANVLSGGTGADRMMGGAGNDTYVVDNTGDVVTENANEGTDTVESSITYILGANVENLTLTGIKASNGTGNALDNVLIGSGEINTLTGGAGNDTLNGGAGADKLTGGTGDDIYVVDNTKDVVTELAAEGTDTVESSITYILGANVENLTLTGATEINGTGNTLDNVLVGNSAANTLTGGTGNDTYLFGRGAGRDIANNLDTASTDDKVVFGATIATDQLWFTKDANHLRVSIIGTADQITIQDWYSGSNYTVNKFQTSNGSVLLENQVQQLVNAMASMTPPPAGQLTLTAEQQTVLNPVLAASWQSAA